MFTWASIIANVLKLGNLIMGMVRDARLRRDGKNELAADNAVVAENAREKADEIQTLDDANDAFERNAPDRVSGNSAPDN
jgi:hypothetical protein